MKQLKGEIAQDVKNVVFYQSESETAVRYPEDEGSHLLKRRAPRRPPLNPAPPETDDGDSSSKKKKPRNSKATINQIKGKIVEDAKTVVFHHPTENCVWNLDDEGSPLLKRLAPRMHRPYPPPHRKDPGQRDSETE